MFSMLTVSPLPLDETVTVNEVSMAPTLEGESLQRAKELLGYTPPEPSREEEGRRRPLAAALRAIGCQCFRRTSVERYQRRVCSAAARKAVHLERQIWRWEGTLKMAKAFFTDDGFLSLGELVVVGLIFGLVIFGTVSFLIGAVVFAILRDCLGLACAHAIGAAVILTLWLGVNTYFAFVILWFGANTETQIARKRAEFQRRAEKVPVLFWKQTPLARFQQAAVPAPVLLLACEIKEAFPAADFVVHHTAIKRLVSADKIREDVERRFSDPFLEVRHGDESYFVAVWDERGCRLTREDA